MRLSKSLPIEVQTEPFEGAIPFDLGCYRPDLIARKQDETWIVEVKINAQKTSFDHLRSVVDEVKRHPGWQFVLVTPQDVLTDETEELEKPFVVDFIGACTASPSAASLSSRRPARARHPDPANVFAR